MDEKKRALKTRKKIKSKKPDFIRQEAPHKPSLAVKWVRPKGKQSKLRRHIKGKGHIPSCGYRSPRIVRGFHPSGLEDVLVNNADELMKLSGEKHAARIAAGVGMKKRIEIQKKAEEMKIRILNPKKSD